MWTVPPTNCLPSHMPATGLGRETDDCIFPSHVVTHCCSKSFTIALIRIYWSVRRASKAGLRPVEDAMDANYPRYARLCRASSGGRVPPHLQVAVGAKRR